MKFIQTLAVPASLLLLAACGSSEEEAPPPAPTAPIAPAAPTPAAPAPGAGGSNFGTVSLSPGFVPDPHLTGGTSGGSVEAGTLSAGCNGWVSGQPDHLFQAGGVFTSLRVMVHATDDTTLVIQKPDNSYACNDDTDGLNPVVVLDNAAAGTYKVWIGSYEQNTNSQYRLAFSEMTAVTPTTVGATAQ